MSKANKEKPLVYYKCSKCDNTSIVYDHGTRRCVCANCNTPLSDFKKDYRKAVAEAL